MNGIKKRDDPSCVCFHNQPIPLASHERQPTEQAWFVPVNLSAQQDKCEDHDDRQFHAATKNLTVRLVCCLTDEIRLAASP